MFYINTYKFIIFVCFYNYICNVVNIEYIAQYGTSGYATSAKGNILYLESVGHNLTFVPLVFDDSKIDKNWEVDKKVCSLIDKQNITYDVQIIHTIPNLYKLILEKIKINYYLKKIGYCTWETDRLPDNWVIELNKMDEIWVPSTYNKTTFEESGIKRNITVFPHIFLEQSLFPKSEVKLMDVFSRNIPTDRFTFYCIAEYSERKGIDDLVKVFNKINKKYKDTQLILKLHRENYSNENINYLIKKFKCIPNIYIILNNINNEELLKIHSLGDCYVSLHKGEGFGLCLYDAVNYKKKIIATNYGGPTDYLTNEHSLVNYKIDKVNISDSFYTNNQKWAYPDLNDAYDKMENIINNFS